MLNFAFGGTYVTAYIQSDRSELNTRVQRRGMSKRELLNLFMFLFTLFGGGFFTSEDF